MTAGKKLTIALAIAIPLLVVGGGLAMAASDAPDFAIGEKEAAPALAVAQLSTAVAVASACDNCTGPCNGEALCGGDCSQPGAGECGGNCAGKTQQCVGSGNCGGNSNGTNRGCGMRLNAAAGIGTACPSCDVVGLNEYPTYSPKYSANV